MRFVKNLVCLLEMVEMRSLNLILVRLLMQKMRERVPIVGHEIVQTMRQIAMQLFGVGIQKAKAAAHPLSYKKVI
jgi:hypothetical protein